MKGSGIGSYALCCALNQPGTPASCHQGTQPRTLASLVLLSPMAGAGPPDQRAAACRAGCACGGRPKYCRYAGIQLFAKQSFALCPGSRCHRGRIAWCASEFFKVYVSLPCMRVSNRSPASNRYRPALQRTPRTTATLSAMPSWRRSWTGAPTAHGCPALWGPPAAWSTSTGMAVGLCVLVGPASLDLGCLITPAGTATRSWCVSRTRVGCKALNLQIR